MNAVSVVCTLALSTACTYGQVVNPTNGRAYLLTPMATSWQQAEQFAVSLGGHLATVRNADEQAWLISTFFQPIQGTPRNSFGGNSLWIGFSDSVVEGQWQWTSGEPVTYTGWAPFEPNNRSTASPTGEDYAVLYDPLSSSQGRWNDYPSPTFTNESGQVFPTLFHGIVELSATRPNIIDLTHGAGTGSFELGTFVPTGVDIMLIPSGNTTVTGWVGGGEAGVHWNRTPQVRPFGPGSKSMDIKGLNNPPFGEVSTTIPTFGGCSYILTFASFGGQLNNTGLVSAGSLQDAVISPRAQGNPPTAIYRQYTFEFTAQSESTVIRFRSAQTDGFGPVIDDVRVFEKLPGCGTCDSIDFNNDGLFPDDNDIIDYLAVLAGGDCSNAPNCNDLDFDNNGLFPGDDDLIAFLSVLAGAECLSP